MALVKGGSTRARLTPHTLVPWGGREDEQNVARDDKGNDDGDGVESGAWGEAIHTTNYLCNRGLVGKISRLPQDMWIGMTIETPTFKLTITKYSIPYQELDGRGVGVGHI